MKALQAANRQLLSAEKRAGRARARAAEAEVELVRARLGVRRMLEALQPELPDAGALDDSLGR
jgi:hypothetical protein